MMKKIKILMFACSSLGISLICNKNVFASVTTVQYNISGIPSDFLDKESPLAYRIKGSPYFPDNTILYKQEYKDITYYAPNPPAGSDEANGESKKYINWGFWDFSLNQKVYKYGTSDADKLFESHFYYPQVKILKKTLVETTNGKDSADSIDVGYVNPGKILNVLSITKQKYGTEIFFNLSEIGLSSGTNIGKIMVKSNNVQYLGTKKDIYFPESANRSNSCRIYTDNFKPYTKPVNLGSKGSHNDLVLTSNYEQASSSKVPDGTSIGGCNLGGRYGEWRYLGLNSRGTPVLNPYFPEDQISYRSNAGISSYDWRKTPWTGIDVEDSKEKNPVQNADNFVKNYNSPTAFDSSEYLAQKKAVLKKLYDNNILNSNKDWSLDDFVNRVSLLTHPKKETAVFVGQRKAGSWERSFIIKNPTRDLYIASMKVKDEGGNVILEGTGNSNDNSFKQTKNGKLEKGKNYTIEVKLGNSRDLELSVHSLSAQVGTVANSSSSSKSIIPYAMTHNKIGIQVLKSKGGIQGKRGSISNVFEFPLPISENFNGKYIDIYGYVGNYHSGVDNLNYKNDTGLLTGSFDDTPDNPPEEVPNDPELPVDLGDLMAYQIELYDGNTLVYRKNYTGGVSVKKAIIPGKTYKIKYTAKYTGEDLWDYKWIEPYYKPVSVWVPGHYETESYWVSGYYYTYEKWVPGYTDSSGKWINGYWKSVKEWVPGHYEYYEVWVNGYYKTEYELVPGYWEKDKISEYSVPIKYSIERKTGSKQSKDSMNSTGYFKTSSGSTSIPMKNGTYMYFETNSIMFEHPYMYTVFNINTTNSKFNPYSKNDTLFARLNDTFDISINNLRVLPSTEYSDGKNKSLSYNILYNANLNTPSYVSSNDYKAYVETSISINGNTYIVRDLLLKGENKDITHVLTDVNILGGVSNISTQVILNYNRESYESGNYSNNSAKTTTTLKEINNPSLGKNTDVASSPNNQNNNSSANRGGDANNNCLIPRTKNTFSSTYNIHKWNSKSVTYNTFNNRSVSFNKYYTEQKSSSSAVNTESFEITNVSFRSKYTKDKKLGDNKDGWIKLLNSNEKDLAYIKAGYGFELKINAEYKTNALRNNPKWSSSKTSGTSVTNVSSGVNIIPDIFVELPGTTGNGGTRKILSASGYKDSIEGLTVTQTKNQSVENGQEVYSWEYTIKPSKSVGTKEVGKIFIPTNTKDGDYKISIYTPPVTGVSSLSEYSTSKYSALCDRKDVNIKVRGSFTDDLNSHLTQH